MKLQDANKKFIQNLETAGKSESTLIAYKKDIEQLVDHLGKLGAENTEDMKLEGVEDFMKTLAEQNYTPKSISRKTNAARTFIKFLHTEGVIEKDFSDLLKHPKLNIKAPRILSKLEYRALRDAAKDDARSYAMIEVLLQTGITISELAGMETAHMEVKGTEGNLFVPKKNNKEARNVPLNKAVIEAIERYQNEDRPKIESKYLFITKTGKPLLVRNIRSTINRFFKLAGVEKAKVNDLRHTFVAHHLQNGVSIIHLAKIAGHKRVSTTEKYLEYIEVAEKANKTELSVL